MTTHPDHNWDEALAELLADEASAPGPAPEAAPPPAEASPPPAEASPLAAEASPLAAEAAVLALGVGDKWLLAALLKGPQIAARTLSAEGLGLAVLDDPSEAAAVKAAETASGTLRGQQVLLIHRGESADLAAGDIQAYLYVDGERRHRVSPGLVLAQSPQLLEDLLIDPDAAAPALARAVDVSQVSAADAIAIIGRSVSAARRAKRGRRARGAGERGGGERGGGERGDGERGGGG
ncbi:MAG: hypothetical protein LBD77_02675 [Bifidobacteriaceae bacterium]|nr:hypothetical protein [Bifidobacteriaceae bacterium]